MKLVVQRVKQAEVKVEGKSVSKIGQGLFVLLGVGANDTKEIVDELSGKLLKLRIMADKDMKMNLDIRQSGGEILLVSQFTLYADTSKGNRPSFIKAANPDLARGLYKRFIQNLVKAGVKVETGSFGNYMEISSIADGPVTIILEK